MTEKLNLIHERVDDIPLLTGLMRRLGLAETFDRHLGNHGLHQGLSTGWLAVGWLAYILSESDHRKCGVQEWSVKHQHTLQHLLGQPIRPAVEFNDDRLGIVLRRLAQTKTWQALESDLWQSTVVVYEITVDRVRLDSTTTYGYHTPTAQGVMQHGHSKDHRPDLPQLKLMAAAAEPSGHLLACDVYAGQKADDPLYLPLIARVRQMLGRTGLLYVGDCKMAALATRADIADHQDYYLTVLPLTGETAAAAGHWIEAIVVGEQMATLIWDAGRLLGGGYEFVRSLSAEVNHHTVTWTERVQVVRSRELAHQQAQHLAQRVRQAESVLRALTPPPGRGKRPYRDEAALQAAVTRTLERYGVVGLLQVTWQGEQETVTHYIGRGRGGPNRPTRTVMRNRYVITEVQPKPDAIQQQQWRLGWRIQVTNLPVEHMSLAQAVVHYRDGWCLERDFHLVKDLPLGISPLYVRRDDQIVGLTRLLTIALRLVTMIETQVRRGQAQTDEPLLGLYEGQPKRTTERPTGVRVLKTFARTEITLTQVELGEQHRWHVTPLSEMQERVLAYLGLPVSLYTGLVQNSL
jgi:transposase